jgi:hypothetical protein
VQHYFAYLLIAIAAYVFSGWTWNRALAAGGNADREGRISDVYFAFAVLAFILGMRILYG